ncbi:MAG: hypothetical protein R3A52_05445 [Polyangiales bacterium]
MANRTLAQIRLELDQLSQAYDARFAGHSRVTRDVSDLDDLIQRTRRALGDLEKLPRSKDRTDLETTARDALALYQGERQAIQQAKGLGADFEDFSQLRTEANLTFAKYHRHFAGQARNTRDLGLLAEMIDDLESIEEAMAELAPGLPSDVGAQQDLDVVRENLKMYRAERGEIIEARAMGTVAEQAGTLGEVANGQFKIYEAQFAGKARQTRRPGLIQRMVDSLQQVLDRMIALRDGGLRDDWHLQNIDVVTQSLGTYKTELEEIRKAREGTRFADLQGMLGGAANEVFEEYRKNFAGQDRKTRNLETLTNICDALAEIGRQMRDLGRAEPTEQNTRNLQIVTDQRVLFEREYEQIEQAKQQSIQ